ncbi:MAG: glycine--tRNA ligase [Fimbriimonadaceae bacterium]
MSSPKPMDAIMSLCKRRGFIFQASEIYGGINGFWDYGPLGTLLKNNLRQAWWEDMVMLPCGGKKGPGDQRVTTLPVDTRIIQHPKVWEASGHTGGFNDLKTDCKNCQSRYRADHLMMYRHPELDKVQTLMCGVGSLEEIKAVNPKLLKNVTNPDDDQWSGMTFVEYWRSSAFMVPHACVCPQCHKVGTLTEPRQFNLMFRTYIGATAGEDDVAYLRPETAQGIFTNFKNVVDSNRVKIPFGIANTGVSFRNEVTPRNFTFRSREFEQMEMEFFCHESEALDWYAFWREFRMKWWEEIGLAGENLQLRDHDEDELSHYSKGTCDIEYRFPFTFPEFGELEGVAYRGNFDLTQHQEHSRQKLTYFDQERGELAPNGQPKGEHYLPHVIEPAAGLDRGVLAVLCEAYTVDPERPSPELMKFHPRLAPIKAAVFPLVNKEGMPEVGEKLADDLIAKFGKQGFIEFDSKQSIGKRYARMDEAGTPYCFTIDGDTLTDQTVTVRHRDTGAQERIALDQVVGWLSERLS